MKFFKKSDIVIVLVIILIGIISLEVFNLIFSNKAGKAEIYYKSRLVETVLLGRGVDKIFTIPQDEHVVFHLYKDGSISFEESDCPDKICIKSGKLNRVGETAACLPNEIFLKIVPVKERNSNDIDIMIGK